MILSLSSKEIHVEIDKNKFRPVDTPVVKADISKLKADTCWFPKIELRSSIFDIFKYMKSILKENIHCEDNF